MNRYFLKIGVLEATRQNTQTRGEFHLFTVSGFQATFLKNTTAGVDSDCY